MVEQLDLLGKAATLESAEEPAVPKKAAPKQDTSSQLTSESEEEKAPSAFRTISEVASFLGVPQHVLRFWESRFTQIKPLKLRGGRRYYRPEDVDVLTKVHHLLYKQGYTIKGAKKAFGQMAKAEVEPAPKATPLPKVKAGLTDKQQNQLAVIRQELMGLRDMLKSRLTQS